MKHYVGVIGPGKGADGHRRELAFEVGRLVAERGAVVVTGGLDGVMEAAAEGAASVGGEVLGLLPGFDHAEGNRYLTIAVPTGLGELRNGLIARTAHAIICVGGSWGTLSEVALAMRTGVPVVLVDGWQVADAAGVDQPVQRAEDAPAAVDLAFRQLTEQA
jgi:uncharacterized protein (TIGR00725 family)